MRQADLAMKVGEPQSWISRIERGSKRRVDVAEFSRLTLAKGSGFAPARPCLSYSGHDDMKNGSTLKQPDHPFHPPHRIPASRFDHIQRDVDSMNLRSSFAVTADARGPSDRRAGAPLRDRPRHGCARISLPVMCSRNYSPSCKTRIFYLLGNASRRLQAVRSVDATRAGDCTRPVLVRGQ